MPLNIRSTDFISRRAKEALKELPSLGNHSRTLLAMALAYDFPNWSSFSAAVTNTGVSRPFDQDLNDYRVHSRRFSQALNLKHGLQVNDAEAQRILEALKPTHDFKRDPVPFTPYDTGGHGTPMFARTGINFAESTGPLMFTHRESPRFGLNQRGEIQLIPFEDQEPVELAPLYIATAFNGYNTFFRFSAQPMSVETLSTLISDVKSRSKTPPASIALTAKDAKAFPQIRTAALQHFREIDSQQGRAVTRVHTQIADDFLRNLYGDCKDLFEEMPSIAELEAELFDPRQMFPAHGLFVLEHPSTNADDPKLGHAFALFHLSKYIARRICIHRKRDPGAGKLMAEAVPYTTPRNHSQGLAPAKDPLEAAIEVAETNDRIPLDPEWTHAIAQVFRNFRESGSGDEEELLDQLQEEVAPLVFGALALDKLAGAYGTVPARFLDIMFGKRSQESQLIDRAIGRTLGGVLIHEGHEVEAQLFGLRLTMTDPSGKQVGLKGLPAHDVVQETIRRLLFPNARVAIDTEFQRRSGQEMTEYDWGRHLSFAAFEVTRLHQWKTPGRTPYTRSSGIQSRTPLCPSGPVEFIVRGCAYGHLGEEEPCAMLEPSAALLDQCSEAVNRALQKWGTGLHCRFEAVMLYNESQQLEDIGSQPTPAAPVLRFDAPQRVQ